MFQHVNVSLTSVHFSRRKHTKMKTAYKVCKVHQGKYLSVFAPYNAELTYKLHEETKALKNSVGIFCFSNEERAILFTKNCAYDTGEEHVCFLVKTRRLKPTPTFIYRSYCFVYDKAAARFGPSDIYQYHRNNLCISAPPHTLVCQSVVPLNIIHVAPALCACNTTNSEV